MIAANPLTMRGAVPLRSAMPRGRCAVGERFAPEPAPAIARDAVWAVAATAIGVNIALSVVDVWRVHFLKTSPPDALMIAISAGLIAFPLHIRHVLFGLRGERPPLGALTLSALIVVNAFAAVRVGQGWTYQLASLIVSIFIIVPLRRAMPLALVVALSPLLLHGHAWHAEGEAVAGWYFVFVLVWRSASQYIPLRLMAMLRGLEAASGELEVRAVVGARLNIDHELRSGVARALERIIARGELVTATAGKDRSGAGAELRRLTGESRTALTEARRLVARYRGSSSRVEVNAVLREWELGDI